MPNNHSVTCSRRPLNCSDDCARDRGCFGGKRCAICGLWFCTDDVTYIDGEYYCDICEELKFWNHE